MCEDPHMDTADWWYTLRIPAQPWMISLVRSSLRLVLTQHGRLDLADTACLLATELVTNGVVHAKSPVTVYLSCRSRTLRVDVHDTSPEGPARRSAGCEDESGRGLTLIDSCATAWGVTRVGRGRGKAVWFTLT
ncbi:anti-sigma regulatory factor (Ser/Thr protein kinase) [Streptomyces olivoverticillatus]|uniref:Anti-sigma regulatory factor (Ser/Thr protein kinase) n=1 Tax=Streptomyces olivoverticillatus TaxID=66427 RepID=A0A7W7LSH7_9ACTN|nr:ATP-binding protein [Streptomyces olivoverticillatus]MBB4895613.1 anti-sigma regulatory factor (Ser/Thr protein kinase) [Streptomyces olivoverticillatus]